MDSPSAGSGEQVYARSGIGEAVIAAGGQTEVMSPMEAQSAIQVQRRQNI